jgi:hypothetical protein
MYGIHLLTAADEVQVLANARLELFTGVLAYEAADVIRFAVVKNWHYVCTEPTSGEGDGDAVRVSHDLIGRERRVCLNDPVP